MIRDQIITRGSKVVCVQPHLGYREYKGRAKYAKPENIGKWLKPGKRGTVADFMVNGALKVELDVGGIVVSGAENWKLCEDQGN